MTAVSINIVKDDGYAASVGLRAKDLIYRINGQPANCSNDVSQAIAKGCATFTIIRGTHQFDIQIDSPTLGVVLGDVEFDDVAHADSIAMSKIILSTAQTIPGKQILETIDLVGAQCLYGINSIEDVAVGIRDMIGGRSKTMQKRIFEARKQALQELREEAHRLGANGVIAISINHADIGDKGGYMLMVTAVGTAIIHD